MVLRATSAFPSTSSPNVVPAAVVEFSLFFAPSVDSASLVFCLVPSSEPPHVVAVTTPPKVVLATLSSSSSSIASAVVPEAKSLFGFTPPHSFDVSSMAVSMSSCSSFSASSPPAVVAVATLRVFSVITFSVAAVTFSVTSITFSVTSVTFPVTAVTSSVTAIIVVHMVPWSSL